MRAQLLAAILAIGLMAGCIAQQNDDDAEDAAADLIVDESGRLVTLAPISDSGVDTEIHAAAGAISTFTAMGGDVHVTLPENAWLVEGRDLSFPMGEAITVNDGESIEFLVSPFADDIVLNLHAEGADAIDLTVDTPWAPEAALVNGERVIELMELQESDFPHRTPGMPNYARFQDYAEDFFTDLGYPVVRNDPYGLTDAPSVPDTPRNINAASFSNVWAYRPGSGTPDKIVGFGGHYDMVEQTTHAAFDDTSGTIATMVLAEIFSDFDTDIGLFFGLWGGEEDGILGSQFFVRTNPDMVAQMITYINLDVIGMAWPGPAIDPDPIHVTAGPDGVVADDLIAHSGAQFARYVPEIPADKLVMDHVAVGQAGGGVNAQSDHTPFISAGVPSYFIYDDNLTAVFQFIHGHQDTLHNLTWFMATQEPIPGDLDGDNPMLTDEQWQTGRQLLAQSLESMMSFAFYYALEVDEGLYDPPVKDQA